MHNLGAVELAGASDHGVRCPRVRVEQGAQRCHAFIPRPHHGVELRARAGGERGDSLDCVIAVPGGGEKQELRRVVQRQLFSHVSGSFCMRHHEPHEMTIGVICAVIGCDGCVECGVLSFHGFHESETSIPDYGESIRSITYA